MSGWKEAPETDGSSHAELTAGAETREKLQTFPVREAAFVTTGRESCREFGGPSKDRFGKFSVGNKKVMKNQGDGSILCLRNSIILKVFATRKPLIPTLAEISKGKPWRMVVLFSCLVTARAPSQGPRMQQTQAVCFTHSSAGKKQPSPCPSFAGDLPPQPLTFHFPE